MYELLDFCMPRILNPLIGLLFLVKPYPTSTLWYFQIFEGKQGLKDSLSILGSNYGILQEFV